MLHSFSQFPVQKVIFIKVFNSHETLLVVTELCYTVHVKDKFALAQFVADDTQVS